MTILTDPALNLWRSTTWHVFAFGGFGEISPPTFEKQVFAFRTYVPGTVSLAPPLFRT